MKYQEYALRPKTPYIQKKPPEKVACGCKIGTIKKNTQQSATSPLSGRPSNKKGSLDYNRVATAAAELGIEGSITDLSDKVKRSIVVLADIAQAAENGTRVYNSKKPVTADNHIGLLVSKNVFDNLIAAIATHPSVLIIFRICAITGR